MKRRVPWAWARLALLISIAAALIFPAAALAWAQNYKLYSYMAPGGINLSEWNSGINRNEISWNVGWPADRMQTTLCDSSYACYPYSYDNDGFLYDDRTISYGRAKCNAWSQNIYNVYVNWCYAAN